MDELGVIGLIAGLWIALAQPAGPGRGYAPYPIRLGWLLVGLSAVLILTATLAAPAPRKPEPLSSPTCGASCSGQPRSTNYPPVGHHGGDLGGAGGSSPG